MAVGFVVGLIFDDMAVVHAIRSNGWALMVGNKRIIGHVEERKSTTVDTWEKVD